MLSPGTLCSLLLLSVFWADLARAGSSFLSPEHQKTQQRKESKKPTTKLQPRAIEGWLHPKDGSQGEGAEDELEIQSSPESTVLTYQTSAASEWSSNPLVKSQETFQFNAPFDVGIKLSGAQYQQHGRSLGKLLQDILWEEAKEARADSDPPQD